MNRLKMSYCKTFKISDPLITFVVMLLAHIYRINLGRRLVQLHWVRSPKYLLLLVVQSVLLEFFKNIILYVSDSSKVGMYAPPPPPPPGYGLRNRLLLVFQIPKS
ncbi:hypothetical protein H5410_013751 [Solanum commersonii]|uniref:Uncharacterized protein n=1 Tax=Solanum commersonii TaxID=4109 RepID=A0A9J5ZPD6_SOLCO|nr:hypothetical protein H5410_013751 [Solanum commersonii]